MLEQIENFFMPSNVVKEQDFKKTQWFYRLSRLIVGLLVLFLPIAYNQSVPEVAGDIRWYMLHFSVLSITVLFFIVKAKHGGSINLKLPLNVWLALFIGAMAIASLSWTYSIPRTWWEVQHLISYIGIFIIVLHLRHTSWYRSLLWLICFSMLFNAILGILQFHAIDGISLVDYFRQAAPPGGTLSNKNIAASYMVLTLPIAFYMFLTAHKKWSRALGFTCFTLGSIFLIYTRSRGSWLAAIAALVLFIIWVACNKTHREAIKSAFSQRKILMMAVSFIVIIIVAQFQSPLTKSYSINKTVTEQIASIGQITSQEIGTRIAYNLNGIDILKDHPIGGVGLGAFYSIYPKYYASTMLTPKNGYNAAARPQRMHNDIAQMFVELGIFAGIAYVIIFLTVPYMTWRLSRQKITKNTKGDIHLLPLFLMVAICGLAINSLGDFPLQMPTSPMLMWLLMGVLTGIYMLNNDSAGIGFKLKIAIPRPIWLLALFLSITLLTFITRDNIARHTGAQYSKIAIAYVNKGNFDENAIWYIRKSQEAYPLNFRTREYMAMIYANYFGKKGLSINDATSTIENMLSEDPYGVSMMVNLAGLYTRQADNLIQLGAKDRAIPYLNKAEELYNRLLIVADFSDVTYTIGGLAFLFKGKYAKAYSMFSKSLEINSTSNPAARSGMARLKADMAKEGRTVAEFSNTNP